MIQEIIDHINLQLPTEVKYCLAELIEKGEKISPAIWKSTGNFSNIELTPSSSYHRIITVVRSEEESNIGCEDMLSDTYTMKLVCTAPKSGMYTDINKAQEFASAITDSNINLSLDTDLISVDVNGFDVDRYSVWSEEFTAVDMKLKLEIALFSLDYTIFIKANKTCLLCQTKSVA